MEKAKSMEADGFNPETKSHETVKQTADKKPSNVTKAAAAESTSITVCRPKH